MEMDRQTDRQNLKQQFILIDETLPPQTWRELANCPIEKYANKKIINRLQFSALTHERGGLCVNKPRILEY